MSDRHPSYQPGLQQEEPLRQLSSLVVLNKALQVRKTYSIVRLRFLQVKLQARIGVSRAGDWKHVHIPSLRDDQTVGWLPSWLVRIDPAREVCRVNGVQSYADSGASSTDEQFQK